MTTALQIQIHEECDEVIVGVKRMENSDAVYGFGWMLNNVIKYNDVYEPSVMDTTWQGSVEKFRDLVSTWKEIKLSPVDQWMASPYIVKRWRKPNE